MSYLEECTEIIGGLNDEGQKFAQNFLNAIRQNELYVSGTTPERIEELRLEDEAAKAEREKKDKFLRVWMKYTDEKFTTLQKHTFTSDSMIPACYDFLFSVRKWLPSFISSNPDKHGEVIEVIFTAGYKAAKAEKRKQKQKKKADVKR